MKHLTLTSFLIFSIFSVASAQDIITNIDSSQYKLKPIIDIEATTVKNQSRSGTCWSFSAVSFFESELMRMGKGKYNLSEMFVVRKTYYDKAIKYVRMHGTIKFGQGGAFHDVLNCIRKYGIVPQAAYANTMYEDEKINHSALSAVLKSYLDAVIKNKSKTLSPAWIKGYQGILDAYLGALPESFTVDGKTYTAKTYADMLGLNPDEYIDITSYTHHPFYEKFILEVPDNWSWDYVYNLPMEEFMQSLNFALKNGYTVAWGADVSNEGFSYRKGLAILPQKNWNAMADTEKNNAFLNPVTPSTVTQEMRQKAFNFYSTTDDHGMQITGIYEDQNGNWFYKVKNSWGTGNYCSGYFYAGVAYVKLRTLNFLVHKSALPKSVLKKLQLTQSQ